MHKYRMGDDWLARNVIEKDLGILADGKLNNNNKKSSKCNSELHYQKYIFKTQGELVALYSTPVRLQLGQSCPISNGQVLHPSWATRSSLQYTGVPAPIPSSLAMGYPDALYYVGALAEDTPSTNGLCCISLPPGASGSQRRGGGGKGAKTLAAAIASEGRSSSWVGVKGLQINAMWATCGP